MVDYDDALVERLAGAFKVTWLLADKDGDKVGHRSEAGIRAVLNALGHETRSAEYAALLRYRDAMLLNPSSQYWTRDDFAFDIKEWAEFERETAYGPRCGCFDCSTDERRMTTFIVCGTCGNKRCPHATNHKNECTGSNEPGQKGSRYGGLE